MGGPVRRALATSLALGVSLAAAGCGSSGPSSSGPLDEALGYLPSDAPLVVAVSTDLDGDQYQAIESILKRFPIAGPVKEQLKQSITEDSDLDFDDDIEPLLGNDFVLGFTDAKSLVSESEEARGVVAAGQAEDADALEKLIEKQEDDGELEADGEAEGAKLYRNEGDAEGEEDSVVAVRDDVVVIADSEEGLEEALRRREGEDRLTEDDFEEGLGDLPDDALLRVTGDLQALLEADPETAVARRVKWVAALRSFGLTASVEENEVTLDFAVDTAADGLSDEDLPIRAGDDSPAVVSEGADLTVGVLGFGQVVRFAEGVARVADPGGFERFEAAKERLTRQIGEEVDLLLRDQLTGSATVQVNLDGTVGVRSELGEPARTKAALRRSAARLPDLLRGLGADPSIGVATPRGGGDFFALSSGDKTVTYGVVGGDFVLSSREEGRGGVADLAAASPVPVEGAEGAVVLTADAERVANRILEQMGGSGSGGQLFTGPLGPVTGSMRADTGGLRGSLRLKIE